MKPHAPVAAFLLLGISLLPDGAQTDSLGTSASRNWVILPGGESGGAITRTIVRALIYTNVW